MRGYQKIPKPQNTDKRHPRQNARDIPKDWLIFLKCPWISFIQIQGQKKSMDF